MKRLFFLLISILILSGSPKNAEATECTLSLLKSISNKSSIETVQYIYVLAAPYYTTVDNLPLRKLRAFWSGNPIDRFSELLMTGQTKAAFTEKWGKPTENASIIVLQKESILKEAWSRDSAWALLPFEELEPRWKVISVRGMDPFDFDFDMEKYALTFTYEILPESTDTSCTGKFTGNFDPEKLTSITLTGTTAMARNLAFHIEEDGLFYPIENIRDTLFASDILHISNEASFYDDCPPAVPLRGGSRFCSSPKYFAILEALGTDIIELTGNHNLDWGPEPFLYSLDLYQKAGIPTYGGGKTLTEGQQPILLEHHGNKIAFLGCNAIGPENIFATEEKPGPAKCDLKKIEDQVKALKSDGWVTIVTFQHLEYTYYDVPSLQSHDFFELANTAAPDIISGSQAHIPQGMTFTGNTFIHFGLGNLLFDQMSNVERTAFFDRHYIYDGRYIGNTLETIILENSSQPRFLNQSEREAFLSLIFGFCPWEVKFDESE